MIKSSKHSIKETNTSKHSTYLDFLKEYRRVACILFNYLWENEISWKDKNNNVLVFNIKNNQLNHPRFLDKSINNIIGETTLSARAISCCKTQICSMLGSSVETKRKQLYMFEKLKKENKSTEHLEKKISKPLTKPNVSNINPELNSICCDFKEEGIYFDCFIQLKSIGKIFGKIRIPIKYHKSSNKWKELGTRKTSYSFSKNNISFRWEIKEPNKKQGLSVGADQGKNDILILSNNVRTPKINKHGYTLDKIMNVLTRKKKGSKAFKQAQDHRKNFINWSINQLNLNSIGIIKLERIVNINFKKRTSRKMSHWTNTLIRDKLINRCEELGVQVVLQSSTYRSQRCSQCGLVRKANRKGKEYVCSGKLGCGYVCDADLNAAHNHEQKLPDIPKKLRELRINLGNGFYWKQNGFYSITGKEIIVPSSKIKKD